MFKCYNSAGSIVTQNITEPGTYVTVRNKLESYDIFIYWWFSKLNPQSVIQKFNKKGIKSIELSGGKYVDQKKVIKFLKKGMT